MNFFQHQDDARKKSGQLIFLLILALTLLILLTAVAVSACLFLIQSSTTSVNISNLSGSSFLHYFTSIVRSEYMLVIVAGVCTVVAGGSLYKARSLRHGGAFVAASLGGKLLAQDNRGSHEKKILNIVEEMAIASGSPVPMVFLIDEPGINAFAAGTKLDDAVIGITRGCIEALTRDELQGVVAHEFSHIHHGDMRLNMRVLAVLHGILVIALIGQMLLRGGSSAHIVSSRRDKKNAHAAILGLALIAVGFGGLFIGNIIKAAVSRQREFLADASSVQYTRNPIGIAKALLKIKKNPQGAYLQSKRAAEYSHFYFAKGVKSFWANMFATHPPIDTRIHRIFPKGQTLLEEEIKREEAARHKKKTERPDAENKSNKRSIFDLGSPEAVVDTLLATTVLHDTESQVKHKPEASQIPTDINEAERDRQQAFLEDSIADVGSLNSANMDQAHELLKEIPPALYHACHTPFQARAIIYLLLLDDDTTIQKRQITHLQQRAHPITFKAFKPLYSNARKLSKRVRLPLLQLCLPSISQLSSTQQTVFLENIRTLIEADKKINVWEWCVQTLISKVFEKQNHGKSSYVELNTSKKAVIKVLRFVAELSPKSEQKKSFQAGIRLVYPNQLIRMPDTTGLHDLNLAFQQLRRLKPLQLPLLLKSIVQTIVADNHTSHDERELLRTIACILDCPMPITPN